MTCHRAGGCGCSGPRGLAEISCRARGHCADFGICDADRRPERFLQPAWRTNSNIHTAVPPQVHQCAHGPLVIMQPTQEAMAACLASYHLAQPASRGWCTSLHFTTSHSGSHWAACMPVWHNRAAAQRTHTDTCDNVENDAVVMHRRSASSRLEAALFDEGVLREHSLRLLAVDRPGHGESSPHPSRNLTTFAGIHSQP